MGTLFIVATPIGNLEDISLRALKTLFSVDVIACEDSRKTRLLLQLLRERPLHFGSEIASHVGNRINAPTLMRYDDRTEASATPEILELLRQGKSVALVSDAGTPLVSDPGYILVRQARKLDIPVVSIPGPSALLAALVSSGLPTDKFMFLGYPPEKQSHRKTLFASVPKNLTVTFYCAPHKLRVTLEDMKHVLGDIEITVARELTKVHEELWSGTLEQALTYFRAPKGEFVILFQISANK
jgi:16S rRNA (cytidine1402-2'-O)-methyltransferase